MPPKCMQRKLLNARLICIRQALSIASFWLRFPLGARRVASKGGGVSARAVLVAQFRICWQRNCFICPLKCTRQRGANLSTLLRFSLRPSCTTPRAPCPHVRRATPHIPIPWPTCHTAHYCGRLARLHICFPCSQSLIVNVCCLARVPCLSLGLSLSLSLSPLSWLLLMLLLLSMSSLSAQTAR